MKTLKIAVMALVVAFTMVSLAKADGIKEKPTFKKVVNISYEKAMTNPGLVAAMYQQISKEDVLNMHGYIAIFQVTYEGNVYRITGTRTQWFRFIKLRGVSPVSLNKGPGIE